MSENKKLTPKIRFKGFTEDWEQRKLPEIANISIGLVTTMTSHYMNHGVLLIRNSDIKDNKFVFDTDPIYLDEKFASENKHRQHQIGDVITVHTGDVGTSAVITENEVNSIGFATLISRPNKEIIDSYYLSTFYNTDKHKKFAILMSTGDGRTNYNLGDFIELIVPFPKKEEQFKIASFINNIDNLITLHQRKYDKLVKIKSSLLEKMFPKNSSKIPEVRFKGFTEDWEQRKFGNIFNYERPDKYIVESDEYIENGKNPVLTANKAFILGYTNETETYKREKESIIFDDFTLDTKFVDFPYMVKSSAIKILTLKDQNTDNLRFNYELLSNHKFNMLGHARHYISVVQPEETLTTSISEQRLIGNTFKELDNLITLHQR